MAALAVSDYRPVLYGPRILMLFSHLPAGETLAVKDSLESGIVLYLTKRDGYTDDNQRSRAKNDSRFLLASSRLDSTTPQLSVPVLEGSVGSRIGVAIDSAREEDT